MGVTGIRTGTVSRKMREWLASPAFPPTALWLSATAACWISCVVNPKQGGTDAVIRYLGTVIALTISLSATVSFPGPLLLTFPMVAVFSFMSPPGVGYGGQIVMFALGTALALTTAAGVLSYLAKRHPLSDQAMRAVLMVQVAVLVLGLGISDSVPLLGSVKHRGREIQIATLAVQARKLATDPYYDAVVSCPLVEKTTAFVATEAGYLCEIDLDLGKVSRKMELPRPEPPEVGLGNLVKYPQYASASLTGRAVIRRLSDDRLSIAYPYHVGTSHGDLGWAISPNYWWIDAEVDLVRGEVTTWSLRDNYMPEEETSFKVALGSYEFLIGNEELIIMGPGVNTSVWTKGEVNWVRAAGDHAVAVSDAGRVYVVTIPPEAL